MRKSFVVLAMLAVMVVAGSASAATLNVPGTYAEIQDAINAASNGDTVLVDDGAYANIDFLGKDIVVISVNGPATTSIHEDPTWPGGSINAVVLALNTPITARISGFNIVGRGFDEPSGAYIHGVQIGQYGGANGNLTVDNNVIEECDMEGNWGGGISLASGAVAQINDNVLTHNYANHGGAIFMWNGTSAVVERNEFSLNQARSLGGPILLNYGGPVTLLFKNNMSYENGSANADQGVCFSTGGGNATLVHNSFLQNYGTWSNWLCDIEVRDGGQPFVIDNNVCWNTGTDWSVGGWYGPAGTGTATGNYWHQNGSQLGGTGIVNVNGVDITAVSPFVGPADLHLDPLSATGALCIDSPTSAPSAVVVDFDGQARDATPDAGADEIAGPSSVAVAVTAAFAYEGNNTVFGATLEVDGSGSTASTYLWTQTGGIGVGVSGSTAVTVPYTAPAWDGSTELTFAQATLDFQLDVDGGADTDTCTCYVRIPGDSNGDNVVNAFDIALLRNLDPSADYNGDGIVNAFDVSILRINSGRRRTS